MGKNTWKNFCGGSSCDSKRQRARGGKSVLGFISRRRRGIVVGVWDGDEDEGGDVGRNGSLK